MNARKRLRVEVDIDTFECLKYFSLLRGMPVGRSIASMLAIHAASIEKEFPPIRAHMLAWRAALSSQPLDAGSPNVDMVPF